ncbi:RadC family protein [[Clostridium] aminophilum]|uniref:DNA repair protein RadC n=1 Tax=[Clostridium] aminophilum TaxID=1526 RepID=A0A1I6IMH3_9FIRM|nr:DNA repair protein RadC [[Clostridium] aminophilum]MCR4629780.1 DNA repair protein RadC [Clostridium sp.]SFR67861.1 DNA repair protein RadC [[Clostridium] aminophilum]
MTDNLKTNDIPEADRPVEKCLRCGPSGLSDAELLAVILRTGSRGENSLNLARRLLRTARPEGILGLLHLKGPELRKIRGIGKVKAAEILCIGELSKRMWRKLARTEVRRIRSGEDLAAFCMEDMRHLEQEEFRLFIMNNKGMLIHEETLFRGSVNASVASPREVYIEALRWQAVSIAVVHNHPAGDPSPSPEDRRITEQLAEAGRALGIYFADHVIIGDQAFFSFRDWGLIR